jgi:hypothetical protein
MTKAEIAAKQAMSPEELLIPRYKVIADFPGNSWNKGDILLPLADRSSHELFGNKVDAVFNPGAYPAIFKRLEWWEERTPADMPVYVKNAADGIAYKSVTMALDCAYLAGFGWHSLRDLLPITEEEYKKQLQP